MRFDQRYKSHHDAKFAINQFSQTIKVAQEDMIAALKTAPLDYDNEHCIYIHVPYCDKICSFCNLNRKISDESIETYHLKVIKQIETFAQVENLTKLKIASIYFGGGTPTILSSEQLIAIIECLKQRYNLLTDCEISCETTLHNLDLAKLKALNQAGVNRLSIGVQTFASEGRKYFNRTYDQAKVIAKIKEIKEVFKGVITIDKIYNYHLESEQSLLADIKIIKELAIDSVSFYSLMIHKGSALYHNKKYNKTKEETDLVFHNLFVDNMLADGDYEVLELTKIARKNRDQYRYIKVRNNLGYTIPFGEGAGGNIAEYSIMNLAFDRTIAVKELNKDIEKVNYLYGKLQFNTFNINDFAGKLTVIEQGHVNEILDELVKEDMLIKKVDTYEHTSSGLFYGNNVCAHVCQEFIKRLKIEP